MFLLHFIDFLLPVACHVFHLRFVFLFSSPFVTSAAFALKSTMTNLKSWSLLIST